MKKIWSVFVGLLATLGALILVGVVLITVGIANHQKKAMVLPAAMVLEITLDDKIVEFKKDTGLPFDLFDETIDFHQTLNNIYKAAKDDRVKALLVNIKEPALGIAQIQELRDAVTAFRAAKKQTVISTDTFGELSNGTSLYYLATAFEKITVQPTGYVGLVGIALQQPFLRGALDQWGIGVDLEKREEFKTAFDFVAEKESTAAGKIEMSELLKNLTEQIVGGVADARHIAREDVWNAMNKGPLLADEALQLKLIDQVAYPDQVEKELAMNARGELTDIGDYGGEQQQKKSGVTGVPVALIYGTGAIMRSDAGGGLGDTTFSAEEFTETIDDIVDNDSIKAVVVRVDSPGGSAIASETIRRGILRLKEAKKKIIVSMGNYAASGGYWMSVDADAIIAEPATLTGSIGVLGGKIALRNLLERNGIHVENTTLNDNASMWSMVDHFTPGQRARFASALDATYADFIKRVAEGRHMDADKVREIAKGRVWTGQQAKELGLVDELGGLKTAMDRTRALLNLKPDDKLAVTIYPETHSPFEKIFKFLGGSNVTISAFIKALITPLNARTQMLSAPEIILK